MLFVELRLRHVASIAFGALLVLLFAAGSAIAGSAVADSAVVNSAVAKDAPLLPPFAGEDTERKYDWVQLESGEWLKGEITRIYDGDLYFDSDEFDDVKLG